MSHAQLAANIDTIVDTFARLVTTARAGDTPESDRAGLDTLSQKLLLACFSLLDLTAELKHAATLAGSFQLQGDCLWHTLLRPLLAPHAWKASLACATMQDVTISRRLAQLKHLSCMSVPCAELPK